MKLIESIIYFSTTELFFRRTLAFEAMQQLQKPMVEAFAQLTTDARKRQAYDKNNVLPVFLAMIRLRSLFHLLVNSFGNTLDRKATQYFHLKMIPIEKVGPRQLNAN